MKNQHSGIATDYELIRLQKLDYKANYLKNYRRFRKLSIEFPENLQGFLGSNGAGKSTIIEAIAWALYGTRAARGAKVDIRSFLAPPRKNARSA